MAEEESTVALPEKATDDEKLMEKVKLDALVSDLSQDYSKYLKVNVVAEVNMPCNALTNIHSFTPIIKLN